MQHSANDIAIIGMAGRFAGCRNVAQFWHNLQAGVECIRVCTDEQLLAAGVHPAELEDPSYV
ncbi:MAG: hypothetical protein KDB23_28590, partial [Planctomycetales bacterium]|nr:hypothetical protein [Planctomycetales bacterium]